MRIALETLNCDRRAGIGRIVRALAREFLRADHEVHIVTQDPDCEVEGVAVHSLASVPGSKGLSKALFRFQEGQTLSRLRCDVCYSFGVGREANVVAAQSCHRAGMQAMKDLGLKSWERRSLGLYDKVSLADERALMTPGKGQKIIACSGLVKKQLLQYYQIEPDHVTVIPNGVTCRTEGSGSETPGAAALRKVWGIGREDKVLLFIGNEFRRKGLKVILETLAKLSRADLLLLVAGAGDEAPYRKQAESLGIGNRVRFLGPVEGPDRLFQAADLFVFPTLYEPFGMVVLEAMAAGIPVITSKSCGAVEGMADGVHGLYLEDPASSEELAEEVQRLLADNDLRVTISVEGRARAREYSWEKVAARHLAVFEGIARTGGAK